MINRKIFDKVLDYHLSKPLKKNIFNLCAQWLLYHGDKLGVSYKEINILIFCIIWPILH
jgi:hypothetical protein